MKQYHRESLVAFRQRLDDAIASMQSVGEPVPSQAQQAIDFIFSLDNNRYATFKADLQNNVKQGRALYPQTLSLAYEHVSG